ncbi:MAG: apolipoprotein N-acyltransferase, partial [Bacteroidales bacterium]|nr:apolipoprotein N-acyltransferase [Bacteroidales bacterium]
ASNILIINTINSFVFDKSRRLKVYNLIGTGLILFFPVILSIWIYSHYVETQNPKNVVIVQPNIDPYHEKFSGMTDEQQLQIFLNLADSLITDSTEFVIGPETAIPGGIWEKEVNNYLTIDRIRKFIKKHPQINIVTGASTFKLYTTPTEVTPTARPYGDDVDNLFYDAFNTAMMLNASNSISFYHKSLLVIGVEKIPYPALFKPLEEFAINLGGTTGSLGTQKERTVFKAFPDKTGIASIICYESIYGEFVSRFVRNGAELIFVITNDGWWENTPGYRQHLSFSCLRAIETRRDIVRSANTGISAIINQRGDILQKTGWWVRTAFRGTVNTNKKITFYVAFGDYIGRIAAFFSILLLLLLITQWVKRHSKLKDLPDKISQKD